MLLISGIGRAGPAYFPGQVIPPVDVLVKMYKLRQTESELTMGIHDWQPRSKCPCILIFPDKFFASN
jgi:hypothetical protein